MGKFGGAGGDGSGVGVMVVVTAEEEEDGGKVREDRDDDEKINGYEKRPSFNVDNNLSSTASSSMKDTRFGKNDVFRWESQDDADKMYHSLVCRRVVCGHEKVTHANVCALEHSRRVG